MGCVALGIKNEQGRFTCYSNTTTSIQERNIEKATNRLKEARIKKQDRFDKIKRIRPRKVQEGDWVLVYDSSLDNQYNTIRKFAKRWFGPYEVRKITNKATYFLNELDGTEIRIQLQEKGLKI